MAIELGLAEESDLTDVQAARIPSLLTKASYLFRQAADRQFTNGSYTQRLQVVGGRARLPETPVDDVDSVVDDDGDEVDYTVDGAWIDLSGSVKRRGGTGWFVTVAYTGGAVPDEVRVTVAQMVARGLNVDPAAATGLRYQDQTMGPLNERKQFFDWAAEPVTLTADDRTVAQSYRNRGGQPIVQGRC